MRGYRIRKFTRQQWIAFGLAVADLALLLYLFNFSIGVYGDPWAAWYMPIKFLIAP